MTKRVISHAARPAERGSEGWGVGAVGGRAYAESPRKLLSPLLHVTGTGFVTASAVSHVDASSSPCQGHTLPLQPCIMEAAALGLSGYLLTRGSAAQG
jgi:hypothetical protein